MIECAHNRLNKMNKDKKAVKRNKEDLDEAWLKKENDILCTFVSSQGCFQKHCEICFKEPVNSVVIKCHHCKKHFCSDCDLIIHLNSPFHRRTVFFSDVATKNLLPHEFVDPISGMVFLKGMILQRFKTIVFTILFIYRNSCPNILSNFMSKLFSAWYLFPFTRICSEHCCYYGW